jgi:hypothetical protein
MYLANHYVGLHNVVVGLALAVAGVAAANLLGLTESTSRYVPLQWMMLVTSLLATAVAYAGTVTGAPVLPPRLPAMLDLVLPMLLGLTEFFLFGVLARQVAVLTDPSVVAEGWFVALAAFGVAAALSIARARSVIKAGVYHADIRAVVTKYVDRMRVDIGAASLLGLLGVAAVVCQRLNHGRIGWFSYAFIGAMILFLCGGFHSQARTRKQFEAAILSPATGGGSPA